MHYCDKAGIQCTTKATCDQHGCAVAPEVTNRAEQARLVTTTLSAEQTPDGNWTAQMLVTGLADERMAHAAIAHMQSLFCGAQINGGH